MIRVYDSGENTETVLRAIAENDLKIKVLLGAWLNAEISNHEGCPWLTEPIPEETLQKNKQQNQQEILNAIKLANAWPRIIVAVNVGNEALVEWNDHMVPTNDVIEYVKQVKQAIQQPVTVADNYKWWADHGQPLADLCDFATVHVYPVWEEKNIDQARPYTFENLSEVRQNIPDKPIVIDEAGWATEASEFGDRDGEKQQLRYYQNLMAWSKKNNYTTFFFEAFDEPWKGDPNNPAGAEKHWGLYTVDRQPKRVMQAR